MFLKLKSKNCIWVTFSAFITVILVVAFLFCFLHPVRTYAVGPSSITPAYEILKNTQSGTGKQIADIWNILIQIANSFLIIVLIVIAFAQILRLNINTYGVKKILPALVLAVVAANFSFLFCRLMVDFANIIISAFMTGTDTTGLDKTFSDPSWASGEKLKVADAINSGSYGVVLWFILAQFLVFAGGVIILILAFLFFIRLWMIYFLVALSPLAIMATVLPQTKQYFNMWWSNFSKWVFMPVASIFFIWLGVKWIDTIDFGTGSTSFVMTFLFTGVCFYLAITTPFKLGGAVMSAWGGLGKKIWGKTGGAAWNATGGAIGRGIKNSANAYYQGQKSYAKEKLWNTGVGQRYAQRRADFQRKYVELPKMIAEKREKDALARSALKRIGSKTLDEWKNGSPTEKMEYSRLKSILRTRVMDEYQSTGWSRAKIGALEDGVVLNRDGLPVNPTDIASGNFHSSYTAAQISKFLEDPLSTYERSNAALLEIGRRANYRNSPDYDQANAYMDNTGASGARIRTNAAGGNAVVIDRQSDPAFYGISGVEEDAVAEISPHIGRINEILGDKSGKLIESAIHGDSNVGFNETVDHLGDLKVIIAGFTPEARSHLNDSFNIIRAEKDKIYHEELQLGKSSLDEELRGAYRIFERAKTGGLNPGLMQMDLKAGLNALHNNDKPNLDRVVGMYKDVLQGINVGKKTDEIDKNTLEQAFNRAIAGTEHFKNTYTPGIKGMNWDDYQKSVEAQRIPQIQTQAQVTAETSLGMGSLAPKVQGNASHVIKNDNPEALQQLTGEINKLSQTIGQAHGIQTQQLNSGDVQRLVVGNTDARGLNIGQTPIANVLNDKAFQRSLAKEIGRSVGTAFSATAGKQTTTNVTNVTNVGAESQTPPQPEEPKGPTTTPPKEEE